MDHLSRTVQRLGRHFQHRSVHVGDLLIACVDEGAEREPAQIRDLVSRLEHRDIPPAARYHRVVPQVHELLTRAGGVDTDVIDLLAALRREGALANLRALRALHQVRDAFADVDVRWLVVKGPVLSEVVYSRPGLRQYHDVDVLVRPQDFKAALDALERADFRLIDPNWNFHRRWVAAELRLAADGGADVDLHWHVLFSRQIRQGFGVPIADLVERAREVVVRGLPVHTLDEADTLIHLSMHACREGGDRLYWLKDIEQSVVNDSPDWDVVISRARAWNVNILVGMMLARTRATLGTPVPDDVVRALVPRTWRAATIAADRLFPAHRSRARGTIATLLAHGARSNLRSSAAATGSSVLGMLRQAVGGEPWRREEWDSERLAFDSPDDPSSKLFPAGDERDRAWLLDELVRESSSQA
jgi:hypothetical protein